MSDTPLKPMSLHAQPPKRSRRRLRRALMGTALFISTLVLFGMTFRDTAQTVVAQVRLDPLPSLQTLLATFQAPVRVGIQIGHEAVESHPRELEALRFNTGARSNGLSEVEVNRTVALRLKQKLEARGISVDLLPATIPIGYRADAVLALHADSSRYSSRRGYKSAISLYTRNPVDAALKAEIDAAYLGHTLVPHDEENITGNMLEYYAFNHFRYRHSVHPRTPAMIVELGYISNPLDRDMLLSAERPAEALARGLENFLKNQGRFPDGSQLAQSTTP